MSHDIVVYFFIIINIVIFINMLRHKLSFARNANKEIRQVMDRFRSDEVGEIATRKQFDFVNEVFSKTSNLKCLWEEFSSNLVEKNKIDREPIYTPAPAEYVINIENLMDRSLSFVSFAVWNSVPQILTSVGIIGTFVSIWASLKGLGGITTISEKFILDLVDAVAMGFISSLFGVLLAVVFTFWEKMTTRDLIRGLSNLNSGLNKYFPVISSEKLMVEQTHILANLSTDISSSISNGFSTMTGSLGPALADIIDDETKKTIKDGVANSFLEMNVVLKDIRDESQKLKEELEELKTSKQAVLETVKRLTEEQNKIQAEINTQSNNLAKNLESFEKILAPLSEVARQVQATNELSDKLIVSVANVSEATKSIQNSVISNEASSKVISLQIADQSKAIKDEYGGLVVGIQGWVDNSNKALQNNLSEFDKNVGDVLRQVLTISNSLNTSVINLERIVKKTDEQKAS